MTLRQLLLLHRVVEHGFSVTAAAEALFTAQSGVSKQLKALGDELGVELFRHEGKRLVGLTPIGKQIDEIAERILRDADLIRAIGLNARKDTASRLRVVATRHTAHNKVRAAVLRFQRTHPKVLLQVSEEQPETVCRMVSTGEAEIGVVPQWHVDSRQLRATPLEHWRLAVAVQADHVLLARSEMTLPELAKWPVASYERGAASRRVIDDAFADAGLASPVVFEFSSSERVLEYVEDGAGIGILAEGAATRPQDPSVRFLPTDGLFPALVTVVVVRRGTPLSWAAEDFIQLLGQDSMSSASVPSLDRNRA